MSIWKTLRQEKPERFATVIILTRGNRLVRAFYDPDSKKFYPTIGLVTPLTYKRWCYEEELVKQILNEIK